MFLHGSRVSADKIINAGYRFKYNNLQLALTDLVKTN